MRHTEPEDARQMPASDPSRTALWRFAVGATLFFTGAVAILGSESFMAPSAQREWIAAGGLLLLVLGSSVALIGYLGLSIFRVLQFLRR